MFGDFLVVDWFMTICSVSYFDWVTMKVHLNTMPTIFMIWLSPLLPIKQGQWYTTKDLLFFHILHLLIQTHTLHIGDNRAYFNDLAYSIVTVLNSGNYGILIIGADIRGFNDETTKDTWNRWIQTRAFYLYSKASNNLNNQPKKLYLWKPATISVQETSGLKYQFFSFRLHFKLWSPQKCYSILSPLFYWLHYYFILFLCALFF